MSPPSISLKARALRYLSSREHSRQELARKLSVYAQEDDDIETLLDWLEASRFLSQERFSESLVHRRSARYGNNRILSELQSHGVPIDADMKADLEQGEIARATDVLNKKYTTAPYEANERARRIRFLQQRGFSHRAIQAAIKILWPV